VIWMRMEDLGLDCSEDLYNISGMAFEILPNGAYTIIHLK